MERILSVSCLVAALACGSVDDRQACGVSTDCPAGQYCARGAARCWPDAVAPVVGGVTASCSGPCVRDGVLRVEAAIADDAEVLDASVSLDLAPGTSFPLARAGDGWAADVPLRALPFPAFARDVVATVTARDGARNPSDPAPSAPVGVTRLRWTHDAGAPITSPAVMDDGTAVVGVSATSGQVLAVRADGTKAWAVTVGGNAWVSAAPAIGAETIWVGSEDFSLYGIELDGSAVKAGLGVNTGGAVRGSVAVLPGVGKEWAFATSSAGFAAVASTVPNENDLIGSSAAFSVGPVIGLEGRVFAATAASSATVRAYRLNVAAAVLSEDWSAAVGVNVSAPIAVDVTGALWTGTLDAKLSKTVPGEASGIVAFATVLPGAILDSPVILATGDVVVGDETGLIHRFTSTGTQVWPTEPNLGAAVHAPLVLAGGDASLVVPTAGGRLFALRGDGSEVWSTTLDAGKSLRAPNLHTPAGQGANVTSTAYVASASGKLFAVVVDGALDGAAPWPKAFHDRRNTSRAGPQP